MGFRHSYELDTMDAGLFEVCGAIKAETEKAILLDDGTKVAWLPKSKVKIETGRGLAVVCMPEWLAERAGFA